MLTRCIACVVHHDSQFEVGVAAVRAVSYVLMVAHMPELALSTSTRLLVAYIQIAIHVITIVVYIVVLLRGVCLYRSGKKQYVGAAGVGGRGASQHSCGSM